MLFIHYCSAWSSSYFAAIAAEFHLERDDKAPGEQISDRDRDPSMDFHAFLTWPNWRFGNYYKPAASNFHNFPCKHTFMRSCLAVIIILQTPKCGSTGAWIWKTFCHKRSCPDARVNNRRSVTRPPANQWGVGQQSHQWLADVCLVGGDTGAPLFVG